MKYFLTLLTLLCMNVQAQKNDACATERHLYKKLKEIPQDFKGDIDNAPLLTGILECVDVENKDYYKKKLTSKNLTEENISKIYDVCWKALVKSINWQWSELFTEGVVTHAKQDLSTLKIDVSDLNGKKQSEIVNLIMDPYTKAVKNKKVNKRGTMQSGKWHCNDMEQHVVFQILFKIEKIELVKLSHRKEKAWELNGFIYDGVGPKTQLRKLLDWGFTMDQIENVLYLNIHRNTRKGVDLTDCFS